MRTIRKIAKYATIAYLLIIAIPAIALAQEPTPTDDTLPEPTSIIIEPPTEQPTETDQPTLTLGSGIQTAVETSIPSPTTAATDQPTIAATATATQTIGTNITYTEYTESDFLMFASIIFLKIMFYVLASTFDDNRIELITTSIKLSLSILIDLLLLFPLYAKYANEVYIIYSIFVYLGFYFINSVLKTLLSIVRE